MSTEGDRRAPGASRVPFEALVEVGGALGPSFEAQSIDISEEGMHLRTAYLPEIGQPLTCRFDAGAGGANVMAAGEVVWKQEAERGGEFAIRFTNLDGDGMAALSRLLGVGAHDAPIQAAGSRVRLHIEGLNSPMRARVTEASGTEVTAFSELGFLQVGKLIDLEDAASGSKRPASIDRVKVEIDAGSHVPHLVMTFKYDDEQAHVEAARSGAHPAQGDMKNETRPASSTLSDMDDAPSPAVAASDNDADDLESIQAGAGKMKGALARGASQVGPAFRKMMNRAKVTIALLAAKRRLGAAGTAVPLRRTTAPAPGGGLHTSGRKVVRGDPATEAAKEIPSGIPRGLSMNKRRMGIGAAVLAAVILLVVAFKKPAAQPPLATAPPADTAVVTLNPAAASTIPPPEPIAVNTATVPIAADPMMSDNAASKDAKGEHGHTKKVSHVVPFGNGPVAHGNVLRIKMDGAIEKIEGASQPTGITVVIPSRRSLEAASPLAARDSRIASIRVANDPNGAELAVAFKDGVPNYLVRAKGDTLEIVLAPLGQVSDGKPVAAHAAQPTKHEGTAKAHGKGHKGTHDKH